MPRRIKNGERPSKSMANQRKRKTESDGPPGKVFEDPGAQAVYERIWKQHAEAFRRLAKV